MTEDWGFTLFLVSHLTRPSQGKSHEEGGRVTQSHFRGSGSIGFWSHFMLGLERDTQAEGAEAMSTTLRVLKDRFSGEANGFTLPLEYILATGRLEEAVPQAPSEPGSEYDEPLY